MTLFTSADVVAEPVSNAECGHRRRSRGRAIAETPRCRRPRRRITFEKKTNNNSNTSVFGIHLGVCIWYQYMADILIDRIHIIALFSPPIFG